MKFEEKNFFIDFYLNLVQAAMIEIEKEKQAKKLERSLSGMFTTADKAPTYRDYLEVSVSLLLYLYIILLNKCCFVFLY